MGFGVGDNRWEEQDLDFFWKPEALGAIYYQGWDGVLPSIHVGWSSQVEDMKNTWPRAPCCSSRWDTTISTSALLSTLRPQRSHHKELSGLLLVKNTIAGNSRCTKQDHLLHLLSRHIWWQVSLTQQNLITENSSHTILHSFILWVTTSGDSSLNLSSI